MALTQTVDIPLDRRVNLNFEVPHEIPTGARVEFRIIPFVKKDTQTTRSEQSAKPVTKLPMTKKQLDEMLKDCPITQSLDGILADLGDVDLDEIRMERLAKHL